ncbi:hypothetical protein [Amaricoccus macauensis]|uniref:hypothetical protein n=1 Tax=Amaricoccus macauensis TaxID=57001 RepID=UPI003C7D1AEC
MQFPQSAVALVGLELCHARIWRAMALIGTASLAFYVSHPIFSEIARDGLAALGATV